MDDLEKLRELRPLDIYKDHKSGLTEAKFREMCGTAPIWHSVDLGDIFIVGARKNLAITLYEMTVSDFPDVHGKSVLDIGAFGGWFSFEAERRGASRVVALDYHSWAVHWPELLAYMQAERAAGRVGNAYYPPAHVVDEINVPGRATFDATKRALGSKVETVTMRVEDYNPGHTFDVVLYLGVLYHCENPLLSMRKVAALTKERLVVETLGVHLPGLEDRAVWDFYADDSVNADVTTWWAPNPKALKDMLHVAGFPNVEIKSSTERLTADQLSKPQPLRIWAHAWR